MNAKDIVFSGKATYQIKVQGKVNKMWASYFTHMNIETKMEDDEKAITILTGLISDQAELMGIINALYDTHLPIISIKSL